MLIWRNSLLLSSKWAINKLGQRWSVWVLDSFVKYIFGQPKSWRIPVLVQIPNFTCRIWTNICSYLTIKKKRLRCPNIYNTYEPGNVFTLIWQPPLAKCGVLENTARVSKIMFLLLARVHGNIIIQKKTCSSSSFHSRGLF